MSGRFSSQPFRLDEAGLCRQLTSIVSPRMRDLLRIAMRVYVADRLTKRNGRADLDGPSRLLPPMVVRVSDPDFWNSSRVSSLVQRAINFVTDDHWEITYEFRKATPRQQLLLSFPQTDSTLESTEDRRPSIRVLQEYRKEWLSLIEAGLRTGRHWASWHGPLPSSSARSVA